MRQGSELVIDDDVRAAPAELRQFLAARVGFPICSVIEEAMQREISLEAQREGFAPSVPFIASLSASMAVGEVIKAAMGLPSPLAPRFQMDALQGPPKGQLIHEVRRSDCRCVARARNIERFRSTHYQR